MDFATWCLERDLIEVSQDGTVTWKECQKCGCGKSGKKISDRNEKPEGTRDMRKDLEDYEDYCRDMGAVWPFKLKVGSPAKPVAPVGK